jgi:cyclopropane fatty-acyl-phospholipid synthase-like methyltransferase
MATLHPRNAYDRLSSMGSTEAFSHDRLSSFGIQVISVVSEHVAVASEGDVSAAED